MFRHRCIYRLHITLHIIIASNRKDLTGHIIAAKTSSGKHVKEVEFLPKRSKTTFSNAMIYTLDCAWGEWGQWSSCGTTSRSRSRTKKQPRTGSDYADCKGSAVGTEECGTITTAAADVDNTPGTGTFRSTAPPQITVQGAAIWHDFPIYRPWAIIWI